MGPLGAMRQRMGWRDKRGVESDSVEGVTGWGLRDCRLALGSSCMAER